MKKSELKKKKVFWLLIILLIAIELVFILWIVRFFSEKQADDVSAGISCDKDLLEKADVLYVIPKYNNQSLTENMSWCDSILKMNKTLALHGVYHTYNEFATDRDKKYIEEGVDIFERCFGFKPERFKSPQLRITGANKELLGDIEIDGYLNQIFHKVYHCNDTGLWPNWLIEVF